MEPQYLIPAQIAQLELQAKDIMWRYNVIAVGHKNWYSIFRVSPNGLIHFYGNTHTGWQHIIDRHSFYSEELYFGKDSLGNPSKFNTGGLPGIDWTKIADDVFQTGVISDKDHKDASMFIKYAGKSAAYPDSNEEVKDFILILYRGTKIVHSLFPKKSLAPNMPKCGKLNGHRRWSPQKGA